MNFAICDINSNPILCNTLDTTNRQHTNLALGHDL